MVDWTEKYRPSTLAEVRGNNKARDALAEWGKTWDDHREAVVLHGAPGVGKTSAAHALANDMGWETVELNASDQRTADVIERFAGRAAMNTTLAGASAGDANGEREGRQLVIMDEADNIHGNYDRGGAGAITRLVKKSNQPIVLIANEYYDMSSGLRSATREIEFRDVSARSIVPVLRDILRKEGIEFDSDALDRIAETNSGDLRSAVKDLQAAADGADRLTVEDVVTGSRDKAIGLFEYIDSVLKEDTAQDAIQSAYAVDETPDDQVKWIEDKVSMVYDDDELARAYEFLANADVWLGRVMATQDYSYWRYATDNVAAGVAAARNRTRGGWTQYGGAPYRSTRDKTRDEVVRKIAESGGFSMGTARRNVLPFLSTITHHCKPRDVTVAMAAWYDLDESAVSFITGSGETTNKVQSIVEDAREMRESEMEEHSGGAFEGTASNGDGTGNDESIENDASEDDVLDGGGNDSADEEVEDDDNQSGLDDFF
ncbi:replication factor C large subunit [Halogeometricum borinquense DSM 11551]|uniref:Replication factor C large subunit n=1 Tax=Halogeometricum borinquense (strain ATCC 700274 / DSM 11551 / JCM 10706 / KCTC 4070 / PR3) TaxID=469382 RepID=E4NPA8_HALBP|nr:replication factor C large subunit [Halogeometricum borinquense]ADQ66463.1 replication factor C large subunit [Halogeometricum borinquense DSM 11551]ELY31183.1 replication factor C large subunit [Halogeometricum borinquense DSM 11551]